MVSWENKNLGLPFGTHPIIPSVALPKFKGISTLSRLKLLFSPVKRNNANNDYKIEEESPIKSTN